jgi:K+-sensing histidine kinase KdpD
MDIQPLVEPLLLQKGQQLHLGADADLPLVAADRRWIGQVLVNLVVNASKYSEANTRIAIRVSRWGGHVRTTVADRGRGLQARDLVRLFEPFHYRERAANPDQQGVSLGLAIVKSVVEAHGGHAGAENRQRGGASIWFALAAMEGSDTATLRAEPGRG